MIQKLKFSALLVLLGVLVTSCATIGPKVSKAELKQAEEEFNRKFLEASATWYPRIHRIGYQLLTSPVPEHSSEKEKFNFIGVGVEELKDYARKPYGIEEKLKGVLVTGIFPGSKSESLDLKLGDVIEKMDGKKVKNVGAYYKVVRKTKKEVLKADVYRAGTRFQIDLPVEKVFYKAQFFLAPTPNLEAYAMFSKVNVGIGAIRYCRNDDELAAIMGHELAHVTLKHSLKNLGGNLTTAVGYGVLAGVIDAYTFPGTGGALLKPVQDATNAKIARRYEQEADYFGMQHAFHSGYDIQNGSKMFARLATDAPGFDVLAQIFASHPVTSERFLRIEKTIEEFKTKFPDKFPMKSNPEWDLIIPVRAGESTEEAMERLIASKTQIPGSQAAAPELSPSIQRDDLTQVEQEVIKKRAELRELELKIEREKLIAKQITTPVGTPSGGDGLVRTNEIGTASLANQGKGQASGYSEPKKL